jgi:hypothetical protein
MHELQLLPQQMKSSETASLEDVTNQLKLQLIDELSKLTSMVGPTLQHATCC